VGGRATVREAINAGGGGGGDDGGLSGYNI